MSPNLPKVRRLPGQSIRDRKEQLTDNWLVPICFAVSCTWILFALEEFRAVTHQPPQPKALLALAVVTTGAAIILLRKLFPTLRNLNRGERGELKVAELLEQLRASGYRVVHDISLKNYNIDHVIVGPGGVFAVETKFRSGFGDIEFRNGEGLFVGGREEEKDSLAQARGSAREVNRMIKDHCGLNT